jgi:hypothetical protein
MTPLEDPATISLEDLMDRRGDVSGRKLRRAVQRADVELGHLTDEEMLIVGRGIGAGPDPFWQPYLTALDSVEAQEASVEATFRLLHANGFVEWRSLDDGEYELAAELAVVTNLLTLAGGAVTIAVDSPGTPLRSSGSVLFDGEDLVLHDWISPGGLHHLLVRRREREADHVAAMLDPDGCAGARSDPPLLGDDVTDLPHQPDELAARASSVTVASRATIGLSGELQQVLTTFSCGDGLWLLQTHGGPEPVATLQRLGADDVAAVARTLLRPDGV